jgi:hypothetical protein
MQPEAKGNVGTCLWCKQAIKDKSVEHIVPEALGCPPELVREDIACRRCNNGLGYVDQGLVRDLGMLAVMKGQTGKKGRPPLSGWSAFGGRKGPTGPELFMNLGPGDVDTPIGKLKPAHKSNGIFDGYMEPDGAQSRFGWKQHIGAHPHFVRAAYKVGLGLCAHFFGLAYAVQPDLDPVREFVRNGKGPFRLVMAAGQRDDGNFFPAPSARTPSGLPCLTMCIWGVELVVDLDEQQRGLSNLISGMSIGATPPPFVVLPLGPKAQGKAPRLTP